MVAFIDNLERHPDNLRFYLATLKGWSTLCYTYLRSSIAKFNLSIVVCISPGCSLCAFSFDKTKIIETKWEKIKTIAGLVMTNIKCRGEC